MWAGSIVLRIGEQRDVLVAVRADSDAALERLRSVFAAWLEPEFGDPSSSQRPALSVKLEPVPTGRHHRSAGPRPVPQLRHGSTVVARSRRPDDIVVALAQVLGGAHLQRRDDGLAWVALRPFVHDGSAVLVDASRPTLVNDRQLANAGIEELPAWSACVGADGTVSIPPPLPSLDWSAEHLEAPPDIWRRFDLAGIVALRDPEPPEAVLFADLTSRSYQRQWAAAMKSLVEAGRIAQADGHIALRTRIRNSFTG